MACIFLLFLLFVASCSEAPAQTQNKTYFWETDSLMPVLSEKDTQPGANFQKQSVSNLMVKKSATAKPMALE